MDITIDTSNFWWLLLALSVSGAVIFSFIFSQRHKLEEWGSKHMHD